MNRTWSFTFNSCASFSKAARSSPVPTIAYNTRGTFSMMPGSAAMSCACPFRFCNRPTVNITG
jgi:hypothetical protein